MCFVVRARICIQQDDADADQAAHPDQTPIDIGGDHALRQRRDQAGLRRRQWMWSQAQRPGAPTKP